MELAPWQAAAADQRLRRARSALGAIRTARSTEKSLRMYLVSALPRGAQAAILYLDHVLNHSAKPRRQNMRFLIGLMIGLMLGASIGLLASPQSGGDTIRLIREQIQRRGGAHPDADDSADD